MIRHAHPIRLFLLCLLISTVGCNLREGLGEVKELVIQPEIAAPLLNTRFTIDSLLTQLENQGSEVSAQDDGVIVLAFEDSFFTLTGRNLMQVEDASIQIRDTNSTILLPGPGGGALRLADIRRGSFGFEIQIGLPGQFALEISLPDARLGGQAFVIRDTLQGPGTFVGSAPLDGYQVRTPDEQFGVRYNLEQVGTGAFFEPQQLTISYTDLVYSYLEGRFANGILAEGSRQSAVNLFGGFAGQDIQVENPQLTFTAYNGLGLPLSFRADPLIARNEAGESATVDFVAFREGFPLAFPGLNQQGQQRVSDITMTEANSNVDEVAGLLPERFDFDWGLDISQAMPGAVYFLDENSELDIFARLELPMHVRANDIVYEDTFAVKTELPDVEQLEEAEFKLLTENRLPVSTSLQVYFLDESRVVIDSLLPNTGTLLAAAPVDVDGQPAGSATAELFIPVTAEQYGRIGESQFVSYRLRIETTGDGTELVKFVQAQDLQIKLGVRALLTAALPADGTE